MRVHVRHLMQRSTRMLAHVRHFNSFTHSLARTGSLHSQVTRSSRVFSQQEHVFSNTHNQKLCFSSNPNSLAKLVLTNTWSEDLEKELEKSKPVLTHESILYVLKKIDRDPNKTIDFYKWVSEKSGFKLSAAAYGLILRILGHKEWMKEFWVVIKRMSDEGWDLDKETYETILGTFTSAKMMNEAATLSRIFAKMAENSAMDSTVSGAVGIVLGSDWSEEVERKLVGLKLSLSDVMVIRVLREIRGYPLRALAFFRWAGEQTGYEHNAVTYNAIVRILGRDDSIEEFWSMVKEMKSQAYEMDIDTYIKVSRQFQKRKMMKEAVELYEFMMHGPYKPSVQDCSLLLRQISSSENPNLDLVFRVVKNYEEAGYSLSKAVYDGIHRSLTSAGRFVEADEILMRMKNAGFEPDNITYSQVVFGLCKAGRLEEACEMLDEMEAVHGCPPDLKTWTILIQGHCLAGEVDKAISCFTKMLEKHCEADADLLDVLVNGLCSKNRAAAAYTLIVEMVEKVRLSPWQATYKHLIQKLLGEGKLEEALKLLGLMKRDNFPPFGDPFVLYISKFGTVEDAGEFLRALTVKRFPSSSVYLNVFRSFFNEGRHSEAQDLLYKCPHHIREDADILSLFGSRKLGNSA